jgi:hypothetical protein
MTDHTQKGWWFDVHEDDIARTDKYVILTW